MNDPTPAEMFPDLEATLGAAAATRDRLAEGELLLEVNDLRTHFITRDATRRAVDGVSFRIRQGRTLGMVGESGCGKSVTSLSILRLVPSPPGRIVGGEIRFKGRNLLTRTEKQMRRIRGNEISMIFQEPMTALNPVFTVGSQVAEVFRVHRGLSRRDAFDEAVRMLQQVRIPDAERRAREYPHQLSGGMRQRVMIAMALGCAPDLLIADEPTTALDVTVQAQILNLMEDLQRKTGTSILMITHDLGVIAETSDEVAVMYAGQIVEFAATEELFASPLHPYTQGLMRSVPRLEWVRAGQSIEPIPGNVPDPAHFPPGCRFHPRCPFAAPVCVAQTPELEESAGGHSVRCLRWREILNNPKSARASASVAHEQGS
ncbi:MAG: Oligopeptide transport ATP-binding protein OppD [candidate division BRC1 bacterium ADurb.BinA292]|nr:MAG: Oligopeptide transport ATP-binding protein OppD [candidate division BRC1 bacterium ADurb.BinA292]